MALLAKQCHFSRLARKTPPQIQFTKRHLSNRNDRDPKFYHNLIYSFFNGPNQSKPTDKARTEQEKKSDDLFRRNIWNRDYSGKSMYSSFLWDGKPVGHNWTTKFVTSQIKKMQARDLMAFDALWKDLNNKFGLRTTLDDHNKATTDAQHSSSPQQQPQQEDGEIDLITMRRKQNIIDLKDDQNNSEKLEKEQDRNDDAKQEEPQGRPSSFEEWRKLPEQKRPKTTDRDHITQFSPTTAEEVDSVGSSRVEPAITTINRKRASNDQHDPIDSWGGLETLDRPAVQPPGTDIRQEKPVNKAPPETEQHWVWDDSSHSHQSRNPDLHPPSTKDAPKRQASRQNNPIKDELDNPRNSEGLLDPHDPFEREQEVEDIPRNTPQQDPMSQRRGEQNWHDIFERESNSEGLDPPHKRPSRSNINRKAQSIETGETVNLHEPFKVEESTIQTKVLPDTPLSSPQIILALQTTPQGPLLVSIPCIPSTYSAEPKNVISLLHTLDNKVLFFSQFERLQREGYALVDGGVDFLIFQKAESTVKQTQKEGSKEKDTKARQGSRGIGWSVAKTGTAMGVGAVGLYEFGKWSKASGWTSGGAGTAAQGTAVGESAAAGSASQA